MAPELSGLVDSTTRRFMTTCIRVAFSFLFALAALGHIALAQGAREANLQKIYGSRWIPLPLPDSRIAPGTIVSIKKGQVAWESSLATCGAPNEVMDVTASSPGTIDTTTEGEYGADAALKIAGVSVGPEFKKVKKTTLKLEGHTAEGIDRLRLDLWVNKPGMGLPPACAKFLKQKDIYIVQEAFKVTKAALTLYDDKNAKISAGGINLGVVKIDANSKARVTSTGTIEFEAPVYTAIRRLQMLKNGDFKTLGDEGGPERTEDKEARVLLYPPAGK
jgi:hypothetical protein